MTRNMLQSEARLLCLLLFLQLLCSLVYTQSSPDPSLTVLNQAQNVRDFRSRQDTSLSESKRFESVERLGFGAGGGARAGGGRGRGGRGKGGALIPVYAGGAVNSHRNNPKYHGSDADRLTHKGLNHLLFAMLPCLAHLAQIYQ